MSEWISKLVEGDKVIVSPLGPYPLKRIETVNRVTKTQVILMNLRGKYRRDTGYQIGSTGNYRNRLVEPIEEEITAILIREAVNELEEIEWRDFPNDFIFEMEARIAGERAKDNR